MITRLWRSPSDRVDVEVNEISPSEKRSPGATGILANVNSVSARKICVRECILRQPDRRVYRCLARSVEDVRSRARSGIIGRGENDARCRHGQQLEREPCDVVGCPPRRLGTVKKHLERAASPRLLELADRDQESASARVGTARITQMTRAKRGLINRFILESFLTKLRIRIACPRIS